MLARPGGTVQWGLLGCGPSRATMFGIEQTGIARSGMVPVVRFPLWLPFALCLGGCSTHPITGREQIVVLPGVQSAYSDLGFALSTGTGPSLPPIPCDPACRPDAAREALAHSVSLIAVQLSAAAAALAPDSMARIGRFRIEFDARADARTASSAGGRIVIGAGLALIGPAGGPEAPRAAGLEPLDAFSMPRRPFIPGSGLGVLGPADVVLAFLLAREMGHVIARHSEEDSGAALMVSAFGLLVPGANIVARFMVSNVATDYVRSRWAGDQQREADELALALLDRSGLSAMSVSFALQGGTTPAWVPEGEWGVNYLASVERVGQLAVASLRYSGLESRPGAPDGPAGMLAVMRPRPAPAATVSP